MLVCNTDPCRSQEKMLNFDRPLNNILKGMSVLGDGCLGGWEFLLPLKGIDGCTHIFFLQNIKSH